MYRIFVISLLALLSCGKETETNLNQKPSSGGTTSEPTLTEYTIYGTVVDMLGNKIPDVVVSDGFTSVKTNSDGEYRLNSDLDKVKFVYLSQPAGYRSPVVKGQSTFHKLLRRDGVQMQGGRIMVDFALEKITDNPDKYTVIFIGDPQSRGSGAGYDKIGYHSTECVDELFRDLKEYTSTISGSNICSVVLGDIVHETMTLYEDFTGHLAEMSYPTYSVIGNHDNDPKGTDDTAGAAYFEQYLGPRNYSFNLGKIHVVVLDNLIMKDTGSGLKSYNQGLTDEIWQWLVSDLKYVDHSSTVMVCAHSPMFRLPGGSDRYTSSSTRHGSDYATLFSLYKKVYAWAGHAHNMYNHVPSSGLTKNVESHTVSRATGGLWTNEWINTDGTPRGYVVVNIEGEDVSWQFKPMPYEPDPVKANGLVPYKYRTVENNVVHVNGEKMGPSYQMRAYPRGEYDNNYVYVNVFMWDEKWENPVFTGSDGKATTMNPVRSYDWAGRELYNHYKATDSKLSADSSYGYDSDVPHLFSCPSDKETDSGTITVKDRFGNTYSATVSW